MGFLTGLFEQRAKKLGSFHVSQTPPGWIDELAGWETATGVNVTPANALEVGAVYACVRVLAESEASLPLLLYERLDGDGKRRAQEHYLYSLLHDAPNPEMTSFEFRETLMGHVLTWGNAYAEIELDRAGRVRALWPLRPDRMKVSRVDGRLRYTYTLPKPDSLGRTEIQLSADRVLHIRGLGYDGVMGYSPVRLQRLGVGLAKATEEYGGRFFGNDARPGGVLEHPGTLSEDAHKRLRDSWESRHGGLEKSHRIAILEEGMKFNEIGLPPEDAQFLGTRKFQRSEIAGWYRVPPHKIGDLERATFSNIEHQGIEFVTDSLGPWLVRWEQRLYVQLLTGAERRRYFIEHLVDALLRGDINSRYDAYSKARQNGWMSANDIRELENMNPIEGGNVYLVPLNMVPAGEAGRLDVSAEGRGVRGQTALKGRDQRKVRAARERHRLMMVHRAVYADVAGRVVRRETNDVLNQARRLFKTRGQLEFDAWLQEFYEDHASFTRQQFRAIAFAYGDLVAGAAQSEIGDEAEIDENVTLFIGRYLSAFASRHSIRNRERIYQVVKEALESGADVVEALKQEFDHWREVQPDSIALEETVRFNNALARTVYMLGGVTMLRWVAMGKSCPYCNDLNGRVVGIRQNFLDAGVEFQPEGAERPLTTSSNVGHAPAHRGCDCMVVAG